MVEINIEDYGDDNWWCYSCEDCYSGGDLKYVGDTPSHTHAWDEGWSRDATYHWHACTGAGATDACLSEEGVAKAIHTYGDAGDARFTCKCGNVDTTRQAAAALADAKTAAAAGVNGVNANDYVTADQETVTNAKSTALAAITAATTTAAVETALSNFNTAIAACTTQAAADQTAANAVSVYDQ